VIYCLDVCFEVLPGSVEPALPFGSRQQTGVRDQHQNLLQRS
jgi:hypothetical protein